LQNDIEWARRRLGTPAGDKIIAEAKRAAPLKDGD